MKNIDDFFGEDQSQNVDTLIEVTKKFFTFVSQLAEIVDELGKDYSELSNKVDQILQGSGVKTLPSSPVSSIASLSKPISPASPPPTPISPTAPPPIPGASTSPALNAPPGFPTPPSPLQATAPPPAPSNPLQAEINSAMQNRTSPPSAPSGLPPLPGAPSAATPGFSPPPGLGPMPGGAQTPKPRMSPMNLKAQMNMELKEAFARIKKGWSEED
ncbi:MAG: hypothetical protein ACFFAU_02465 [Candidatus Hodarchaeota archaeon]